MFLVAGGESAAPCLAIEFGQCPGIRCARVGRGAVVAQRLADHLHQPLVEIGCEEAGIVIARNLIGSYCTSLDMVGFSITLLKADEETLALWDAPVHTPALNWGK